MKYLKILNISIKVKGITDLGLNSIANNLKILDLDLLNTNFVLSIFWSSKNIELKNKWEKLCNCLHFI